MCAGREGVTRYLQVEALAAVGEREGRCASEPRHRRRQRDRNIESNLLRVGRVFVKLRFDGYGGSHIAARMLWLAEVNAAAVLPLGGPRARNRRGDDETGVGEAIGVVRLQCNGRRGGPAV